MEDTAAEEARHRSRGSKGAPRLTEPRHNKHNTDKQRQQHPKGTIKRQEKAISTVIKHKILKNQVLFDRIYKTCKICIHQK
jgi:hypothetical protein